jgi:hypothetical protein
MDGTHLTAIVLVADHAVAAPLTGFQGGPVLAYASLVVLVLSLLLFSLKFRYPVNVLSPAKGRRAKPPAEEARPSRWPFSLAWTTGYALAGWYIAITFGAFR